MFYLSNIPDYYLLSEYFNKINYHGDQAHMPLQYFETDFPIVLNYITFYKTPQKHPYIFLCTAPDFYSYLALTEEESLTSGNNGLPHQHNVYELMYVLSGTFTLEIESKTFIFPTGSGCLIGPNLEHRENDFEDSTSVFYLQLSSTFAAQVFSPHDSFIFQAEHSFTSNPLMDFLLPVHTSSVSKDKRFLNISPCTYFRQINAQCRDLCETLIRCMLNGSYGSTYELKCVVSHLFSLLSDVDYYQINTINLNHTNESVLFYRITHLMRESHGRITRSELEKILSYNGIYLNSIVKKYTGMTIFEYGMTFCMRRAEALLLETELSIQEISETLHFTNRTHFYNLFKKKYGMTPGEFRKQH